MSIEDAARLGVPESSAATMRIPAPRGVRAVVSLRAAREASPASAAWLPGYLRALIAADAGAALLAAAAVTVLPIAGAGQGLGRWWPLALAPLWLLSLSLSRAYESRFLGVGSEEFRRVAVAGVTLVALVATIAWSLGLQLGRPSAPLALPLATVLTLGQRYLVRKALHRRRSRGECLSRVLVVGHVGGVAGTVAQLRSSRYHGLEVVAACVPSSSDREELDHLGVRVEGDLDEVVDVAERLDVDVVAVLTCPEMDGPALRRLGWDLERTNARLVVAPALIETVGPRLAIHPVCGLPFLSVDPPELTGVRRLAKEAVDRFVAAVALLVLLPVFVLVALAIRCDSRGPVFFRQRRVGRDGREFTMFKFRTMVRDAEKLVDELKDIDEGNGVLFKVRRDPRITRVGALLRRYSLDELPQLINVLTGRMSLVGPRPPLPREVEAYPVHVRRRLLVKPGLTGLWQINGRSDLDWEETVRLDLRYVENWSFAFDVMILWKTAAAVVRGTGAY